MDLREIRKWAEKIDILEVKPLKRDHASCYKKMILEHIDMIDDITSKIDGYMEDINEYITQLDKIEIRFPTDQSQKEVTVDEQKEERKPSPLLP